MKQNKMSWLLVLASIIIPVVVVVLGVTVTRDGTVEVSTAFWIIGIAAATCVFAFTIARMDFDNYVQQYTKGQVARPNPRTTPQAIIGNMPASDTFRLGQGTLHRDANGWEYHHDSGVDVPIPAPDLSKPADDIEAWILNEMSDDEDEWGRR